VCARFGKLRFGLLLLLPGLVRARARRFLVRAIGLEDQLRNSDLPGISLESRFRTIFAVSLNWARTHGGMTESPPATEIQDNAYAIGQDRLLSSSCSSVWPNIAEHAAPLSNLRIAVCASSLLGFELPRTSLKSLSKPPLWGDRQQR
jgi:hypothetical protein